MKKLISALLICALVMSMSLVASAEKVEIINYQVDENILTYFIDQGTGKSYEMSYLNTGLTQEDLYALSDEALDAMARDYLDSLPQTGACSHSFVLKNKQWVQYTGLLPDGTTWNGYLWLMVYECSKCARTHHIYTR